MPIFIEALLEVTDQQFWLLPVAPGFDPDAGQLKFEGQESALAGTEGRAIMIMTGIWGGQVAVKVALHEFPPVERTDGQFEEFANLVIDFGTGEFSIAALGSQSPAPLSRLSVPGRSGRCVVSVAAVGRDVAPDSVVKLSSERYQIDLWASTV